MKKYDYKRHDTPISFRIPNKLHEKYKSLSGFERQEIQYKFNLWLRRILKSQ